MATVINRHSLNHTLKFAEFVKQRYTESKLDNARFAELATKELGFPCCQSQVLSMRTELGLPPNRLRVTPETGTVLERLARLEEQVKRLLVVLD